MVATHSLKVKRPKTVVSHDIPNFRASMPIDLLLLECPEALASEAIHVIQRPGSRFGLRLFRCKADHPTEKTNNLLTVDTVGERDHMFQL